jgi:glycosyltransferase involved in cell wall biosynthesis
MATPERISDLIRFFATKIRKSGKRPAKLPGKEIQPFPYLRAMRISMMVSNDLATDQRVLKMCHTLNGWGHRVNLTGRMRRNSPPLPDYPFKTTRLNILFDAGPMFYMCLQFRLFIHLLFSKQDLIYANDLDTLLPAWLVSRIKGKKLVYDTHEYFTGVPELNRRPMVRKTWKLVESLIFPRLRRVITVNESIAALYQRDYGILPSVVRNLPSRNLSLPLADRPKLGLPSDKFILIMQGNGINVDRGAEEAVAMMNHLQHALLLIIGSGDVIPNLKKFVALNGLEEKVRFFSRMPYAEMLKYTVSSDLGLSLDKDSNINYRFSLPNKLFDYIRAGIPVLASDLPEVRKIVDESGCGIITSTHDPARMAELIHALRADSARIEELRRSSTMAANQYSWETEVQVIYSWFE